MSLNAAPRRLRQILSLDDFERLARRRLPRSIFAFVNSGVEDEVTLRDNRAAFQDYRLVPRVLVGVANRTQKTTVLGETYDAPFGVPPMGMESLVGYRGDISIARACAEANIPFVLSGASLIRLEEIREVCPAAWFQAYLLPDFTDLARLIERVRRAGYATLVITVDMTSGGNRENMVRAGFSAPFRPSVRMFWDGATHPAWSIGNFLRTFIAHGMPHFENVDSGRGAPILSRTAMLDNNRAMHTWEVIGRIRRLWAGRLVVKGLLDAKDVKLAVAAGADAIIVSSHGGRQVDGVVAPLRALPACVEAAGEVPVMIDSGIRRGTDVLKCLALGAKFVFIGRPMIFASILGTAGVRHAIGLLQAEIARNMGNLGINTVAEMTPDRLFKAGP